MTPGGHGIIKLWHLAMAADAESVGATPDYLQRWVDVGDALLDTRGPIPPGEWETPQMFVQSDIVDATGAPQRMRPSQATVTGARDVYLIDAGLESLKPLFAPYGQLLPVAAGDRRVEVWHCTTVVDCLDADRSELLRSEDDPSRVLLIEEPVFDERAVPSEGVFVLPGAYPGHVWVTQDFVQRYEATGAYGLRFTPAWESTAG